MSLFPKIVECSFKAESGYLWDSGCLHHRSDTEGYGFVFQERAPPVYSTSREPGRHRWRSWRFQHCWPGSGLRETDLERQTKSCLIKALKHWTAFSLSFFEERDHSIHPPMCLCAAIHDTNHWTIDQSWPLVWGDKHHYWQQRAQRERTEKMKRIFFPSAGQEVKVSFCREFCSTTNSSCIWSFSKVTLQEDEQTQL